MTTIQVQINNHVFAALGSYATERKTTVQQILSDYINSIVLTEERKDDIPPIVSRLWGCAANTLNEHDIDGREAYNAYLENKHQ